MGLGFSEQVGEGMGLRCSSPPPPSPSSPSRRQLSSSPSWRGTSCHEAAGVSVHLALSVRGEERRPKSCLLTGAPDVTHPPPGPCRLLPQVAGCPPTSFRSCPVATYAGAARQSEDDQHLPWPGRG